MILLLNTSDSLHAAYIINVYCSTLTVCNIISLKLLFDYQLVWNIDSSFIALIKLKFRLNKPVEIIVLKVDYFWKLLQSFYRFVSLIGA